MMHSRASSLLVLHRWRLGAPLTFFVRWRFFPGIEPTASLGLCRGARSAAVQAAMRALSCSDSACYLADCAATFAARSSLQSAAQQSSKRDSVVAFFLTFSSLVGPASMFIHLASFCSIQCLLRLFSNFVNFQFYRFRRNGRVGHLVVCCRKG